MKISISKKIMSLSIIPLLLLITISSIGSAVLLGSSTLDEIEKELKLSVYAIEKETEQMNAGNTKMEVVNTLLVDFKEKNNIDITIFSYNTRAFSTVPNAVGTKMDGGIYEAIKNGDTYFSKNANVNGEKYYAFYDPIIQDGEYVGAFFAGEPASRVDQMIVNNMLKMMFLTMSVGVIVIIISAFVARKIAKKLNDLKIRLNTLSDNDLATKYDRYVVEHDEIETLSNNMVDISEQWCSIVGNTTRNAEELKEISTELKDATEGAANITEEITQAVQHVANGAENQARDTTELTEQVSVMGEDIMNIKENTEQLSSMANSMSDIKDVVLNDINELERINNDIKEDIASINEQVEVTNHDVEDIQSFIDIITDITAQTNLLSLNASIEAAHAGEQGKGFAVVAEEIRKLAEQSANSAEKIENKVKVLLKNYAVIINKMSVTTSNIAQQNEKIVKTEESFNTLGTNIGNTVVQIKNINELTESLNEEKNQIVDAICNLSAISQENSASAQETMAGIEELNATVNQVNNKAMVVNDNAELLMNEVSVFKIN